MEQIYISEQQAQDSMSMKEALKAVREAYLACADGQRYAPGRIVKPIRG